MSTINLISQSVFDVSMGRPRATSLDLQAERGGLGIPAAIPRWAIPVMILDCEVHLLLWTKSHAY